jgi:uncharacterized membrane protein
MVSSDDKKRPAALNLTPQRTGTADSSSTDASSLKGPRTPRFAEATSVRSPVDGQSPFADPPSDSEKSYVQQAQPADVGFGYIGNPKAGRESVPVPMTPKSPLKSAMKVPGTPARTTINPLSPTFREEAALEKQEARTDKQQARDLKIKARVRMAKFALRGVNFSCSLIILAMLSTTLTIFNSTRSLPDQSKMPAWAKDTNTWPQKLVLAMACVSLLACIIVFLAYCRGGHKRAEKVGTYYTMFAIGWFVLSMILWVISAALFQNSKNTSNNKDMWGWSCVNNHRSEVFHDKVDYALLCRLQNWTLICIIIEVVVEVVAITLYSVVFYRYWSKRRLAKSMDMRDRARSDMYLAQLRSQSAPNTPGFGPKSPGMYSQHALSPRHAPAGFGNLGSVSEDASAGPFTPGGRLAEPQSQFAPKPASNFVLQAPPTKAPSATPKTPQSAFTEAAVPGRQLTPPAPPAQTVNEHYAPASDEPVYDAVPIPGAYNTVSSPPPNQVSFQQRYA